MSTSINFVYKNKKRQRKPSQGYCTHPLIQILIFRVQGFNTYIYKFRFLLACLGWLNDGKRKIIYIHLYEFCIRIPEMPRNANENARAHTYYISVNFSWWDHGQRCPSYFTFTCLYTGQEKSSIRQRANRCDIYMSRCHVCTDTSHTHVLYVCGFSRWDHGQRRPSYITYTCFGMDEGSARSRQELYL